MKFSNVINDFLFWSRCFWVELDPTYNYFVQGGTALSTPKLACFVLYLKIINTFLKHIIYIL